MGFKIGDIVVSKYPATYALRSGGEWYSHAIVACINPLILVSESADMCWSVTIEPDKLKVIGEASPEQLAKAQTRLTEDELTSTTPKPAFIVDHIGTSYGSGPEHTTVLVGHSAQVESLVRGTKLYTSPPNEKWREAVQRFVDRVERGEIRSVKTYAEFKELLK